MQFFALNKEKQLISAYHAKKQEDYVCRECKAIVRVRGGHQRQRHFFHFNSDASCRQSQKSLTHLQVQRYLLNLLPEGESQLERRFPEIDRIADVAWEKQKIIFEVQYSGISEEEIGNRNIDYAKLGYKVVWILHDIRFNKWKITEGERLLRESPHYYTNINQAGKGCIYDQIDVHYKGKRRTLRKIWDVKLDEPKALVPAKSSGIPENLKVRLSKWTLYFSGDLIDLWKQSDQEIEVLLQRARHYERQYYLNSYIPLFYELFQKFVRRPYFLFFNLFLERLCR